MKKFLILLLLMAISFMTHSITLYADEVIEEDDQNYSYAINNSDYDRIYQDDQGKWHGVISVTETHLFTVNNDSPLVSLDFTSYMYFVEIAFSRETKQLYEIQLSFTREAYCSYRVFFCVSSEPEFSERKTYSYDEASIGLEESKDIGEVFGDGSITRSIDPNYDWVIDLHHTTTKDIDATVEVIDFYYILTDAEIIDLKLDIQEQFDEELSIIISNPILSPDERDQQIAQLQDEYADYEDSLDFDVLMYSDCVGDCYDEHEGTSIEDIGEDITDLINDSSSIPQGWKSLIIEALKIIGKVLAGIFSAAGLAYAIYYLTKKGIATSIDTSFTIVKKILISGAWWGKQLAIGIWTIVETVGLGLKTIFGFK